MKVKLYFHDEMQNASADVSMRDGAFIRRLLFCFFAFERKVIVTF